MAKRISGGNGVAPPAAVAQATQVVQAAQTPRRMALDAIREAESSKSEKIVLYAPEGWGKSTWASKAESPVFLSTEDGLKNVKAKAFPEPENWNQVFEVVDILRREAHDYKTLVIDTVDWTEHLCHIHLLDEYNVDSIEKLGGGYGKGYVAAFEEWKRLLGPINALRREKDMTVIFLAHAAVRTFNNPEGDNYDRYEMKTDKRVSALLKEWADAVLFGIYDVAVDKKKGYGGDRKIHANHSAAWDAKNRYDISKPLSSEFSDFWRHVRGTEVAK